MMKNITSIVAGYLTMAVAVMALFAVAYPVLGPDFLLNPGTYEAAGAWIGLSMFLSLLSAMAGGWVCQRLATNTRAPLGLAGVVLVLGLAMTVSSNEGERGGMRPPDATMSDVMTHARQPGWVGALNPVLGVVGVLLGAGVRRGDFK